jgi:surface protein
MKIKISVLFLLFSACLGAQTILNSPIAVQPNLDNTVPFSFAPQFRYDTTTFKLYAFNQGVWKVLAEGSVSADVTTAILNDSMQVVRDSLAALRGDIGGKVDSLVAGDNTVVDNTDPANPIVGVPTIPAADVTIVDAGGLYIATEVEAALQEEATNRITLDTIVGNIVSLTGMPVTSTTFGTFPGLIFPDNQTGKALFQMTETNLQAHIDSIAVLRDSIDLLSSAMVRSVGEGFGLNIDATDSASPIGSVDSTVVATLYAVDSIHRERIAVYVAVDSTADPAVFSATSPRGINILDFGNIPSSRATEVNIGASPIGKYIFHIKNSDGNTVNFSSNFLNATGELIDEGSTYQMFKDQMWDCYSDANNYYCNSPNQLTDFEPFVFTIRTDSLSAGSTGARRFKPPFEVGGNSDFIVNWGDGTEESFSGDTLSHTYAVAGTYDVTILGGIGAWAFDDAGDKLKITNVIEWGDFVLRKDAFRGCTNLNTTASDAPTLVSNIDRAFSGCTSLTTLDVSGWNTANVVSMKATFLSCGALTALAVADWNVSLLQYPDALFLGCSSVAELDVSNWNTRSMLTTQSMFSGCESLDTLAVANWDVSNVTGLDLMFFSCSGIEHLDLSLWDVSNVTSMYRFAGQCTNLISVSWAGWDVSSVANFSEALNGNINLVTLDVSTWNTSSAVIMDRMFRSCTSLTTLDVSNWDVSLLQDPTALFLSCSSLAELDVSSWNTGSMVTTRFMFSGCESLDTLAVENWDVSNVTTMDRMFRSCTSLVGLDPSGWDVSEVTDGTDFAQSVEMSTANYNATLVNWEAQSVQNNVSVNFGSSKYSLSSAAATARAALIADHAWTITDGGGI